jgi:universal stress protein E
MKRFKRILVGVDLSWGDRFVADELSEPNAEAVRQALWLAKLNSATVDFFFSIELSEKAQLLISRSTVDEPNVLSHAMDRLAKLVAMAKEEGVLAESHVVVGKSWLELIHQVLRNQNDLVIVGTRHQGAIRGMLVGSTGTKLLRKCPCPVWVTHPAADRKVSSILVAHDLRPVGDLVMEFGCSMASIHNAQLHVVHAVEFPELDHLLSDTVSAEQGQAYREEAEKHIETQLARTDLQQSAKLHLVTEPPDLAIMHCVEQYQVDLVVMGTVGRSGIAGFTTGNTAERLMPQIPCSLLAVKPPGFESPVTI